MYEGLKLRREALGMSLQELAEKTGISKSSLQRYENGITKKIPLEAAEKLQKVLGIKFTDSSDELDISAVLQESLDKLDSDCALMFDGKVLDDRTRELLLISLKNSIRMAKMTAKNK